MQPSPAYSVQISRFGLWRAVVVVLTILATFTISAWWVNVSLALNLATGLALGLTAVVLAGALSSLLHLRPITLRWDGQRWHLGPVPASARGAQVGDLWVSIDLGSWMLLRFRPEGPRWRRRTIWLPVQRGGLEAHWHALRCTVYSPRPATGGPDRADL